MLQLQAGVANLYLLQNPEAFIGEEHCFVSWSTVLECISKAQ